VQICTTLLLLLPLTSHNCVIASKRQTSLIDCESGGCLRLLFTPGRASTDCPTVGNGHDWKRDRPSSLPASQHDDTSPELLKARVPALSSRSCACRAS
jgi:hypothetical protein